MAKRHHPHRGSLAFIPSVRARKEVPRIKSWAENQGKPKVMGFAGYKAGMTHAFITDYRKKSTTTGQEVRVPVTVIETPPMTVCAIRCYTSDHYGHKAVSEVWTTDLDKEIKRRIQLPKKYSAKDAWKKIGKADIEDVRVLMYTSPKLISGIPKKAPDIMEQPVKGGTIEERIKYAKSILGKILKVQDFTQAGKMVDTVGVTKGKGFTGVIKRRGVKLLTHKNSKHRRLIGTLGPWHPAYVMWQVPQAGQHGYHQRTEYNKRILKIGEASDEITPKGGFMHYGNVKNDYVIIHGSVPGPTKRLIRLRDAVRFRGSDVDAVDLTYISRESQQGT